MGALHGRRDRKGVFVTTSTFTSDAIEYAAQIDTKVVLVDGRTLARLMILHFRRVQPRPNLRRQETRQRLLRRRVITPDTACLARRREHLTGFSELFCDAILADS